MKASSFYYPALAGSNFCCTESEFISPTIEVGDFR